MCDQIIKESHIINNLELDIPIYKYIKLEYFMQMMKNGQLYYDKISSWADVYENFLLKERFVMDDGTEVCATKLINGVFGQCWTSCRESDAMWRIYSAYDYLSKIRLSEGEDANSIFKRFVAVRIRTTARKLFDATYRNDNDASHVYIGNVSYKSEQGLHRYLEESQPISPLDLNLLWTQSVFMKRDTFSHENEVRSAILISSSDKHYGESHLLFNISPTDFVDEVTLDPRLLPNECDFTVKELEQCGVKRDIINQSQLYHFTQQTLQLL